MKKKNADFRKTGETFLIPLINKYKDKIECKKSGHVT